MKPEVRDYGTLREVTADFDVGVAAGIARSLVMLQVSPTISPGGGSGVGGLLGSGGATDPTSGGVGGTSGGGVGGVSGSGGTGGGGAAGTSGGGGGGSLPFTGLAIALVAGVGAAFSGVGIAVRRTLRRR